MIITTERLVIRRVKAEDYRYQAQDGLGWGWYRQEYDENGNLLSDEYTGQA